MFQYCELDVEALNVEHWTLNVSAFPRVNSYTHPLTHEQATRLRALLEELSFTFAPRPYTLFFAQKEKLSVAVYEKGPKVLLQGKGHRGVRAVSA